MELEIAGGVEFGSVAETEKINKEEKKRKKEKRSEA
jgi:hypothetical protein